MIKLNQTEPFAMLGDFQSSLSSIREENYKLMLIVRHTTFYKISTIENKEFDKTHCSEVDVALSSVGFGMKLLSSQNSSSSSSKLSENMSFIVSIVHVVVF